VGKRLGGETMKGPEEKELRRLVKSNRAEWWIVGAALVASVALLVVALLTPRAHAEDAKVAKIPAEIPNLAGIWMLDKEHSEDPAERRPRGGGAVGHRGGGGRGGGGGGGGGGGHPHGGWGGGGGGGEGSEGGPPPGEEAGSPPSGGEHQRPQPQPEK